MHSSMFVRYFMDMDVPFAEANEALLADPASWLPDLARETDQEGVHLLTSVGFGMGIHVRKRVEVEVDAPLTVPGRTSCHPVERPGPNTARCRRWRATWSSRRSGRASPTSR